MYLVQGNCMEKYATAKISSGISWLSFFSSVKSKFTEVSDSLLFLPVARGKNFFFSEGKTNSGLEMEVVDFKCICFPSYQPGISKAEMPGSFQCPLKTREHCTCYSTFINILFIFTSILKIYFSSNPFYCSVFHLWPRH